MLSSVLKSPQAVQVNIAIMRAFVQMRRVLFSNAEFEKKLNAIEAKLGHHDRQVVAIFEAIRKLAAEPATSRKRVTGLTQGE